MIYTLDTNVLVDALRRPADMPLLEEFLEWALPHTALSSVVASELPAGAAAWAKTGGVLGRAATESMGATHQNDLLLAHTAREFGWCLVTRDRDFTRVRLLVKGLRVEAPFPRRPTLVTPRGRRYHTGMPVTVVVQ